MGGFAIQRFVDSLQDVYPTLKAVRIAYNDLPTIIPADITKLTDDTSIIAVLITHLVKHRLIVDLPPVLDMGSTRLAAWHATDGNESFLHRYEKPSDALKAMVHKLDFGDIDVGVRFAVDDPKRIVAMLHDKMIGGYHFFARRVVDIHLGVLLDDERMVQIDLNNIASNPQGWYLSHFSSFLDLKHRLPGVYQTSMIRVLVNRYPTPDVINDPVYRQDNEYRVIAEKAMHDGFVFDGPRCSFTPDGSIYVVHEWSRQSRRSPTKTTRRKFKFSTPLLVVDDEYDVFIQTLFTSYVRYHLGDKYVEQNDAKIKTISAKELFHLTKFIEFIATTCPEIVSAFLTDIEHDIDCYVGRSTPDSSIRMAAKLRIRSLLRRHYGDRGAELSASREQQSFQIGRFLIIWWHWQRSVILILTEARLHLIQDMMVYQSLRRWMVHF